MATKKVKAVFRGKDGSEGFVKNHEYTLELTKLRRGNFIANATEGMLSCEYESFLAFLNNWDNIRNV